LENAASPFSRFALRLTAALVFFILVSVPSSPRAAGPGTSAATFLQLGFGARPLALGEAFVAVADDASAMHYNPAGLALPARAAMLGEPRRYEMMVSHAMHIQDIRLSQMGLMARPWGVSLTHLQLGGIERRTTETARPDGHFGASDLMLGFSYGKTLGLWGTGLTVKTVRQSIGEYTASAWAADFGVLRRFKAYPVSFGASIVNLGQKVTFIEEGFSLPTALRVGATYGMSKNFPHALSLQLEKPRDGALNLRLGLEYLGFGPFALRAGYRTVSSQQRSAALGQALGSQAPGLSEFYGMFLGTGFRSKFGNMDYTLLPYGELGTAHRLSFSVKFGNLGSNHALGVFK